MAVTRHTKQTLLIAACFAFIMFGLVTICLVIYKMPLFMIVTSVLASCAGLAISVAYCVCLYWRSLTRLHSQRLDEVSHLLSGNSDLEAGASYGIPLEAVIETPERKASLPLPTPRPRPPYFQPTPQPVKSYRLHDYMTRILTWGHRNVKQSRRHTVSESAVTDYAGCASTSQTKSKRTYTKSESAVVFLREGMDCDEVVQKQLAAEDIFEME